MNPLFRLSILFLGACGLPVLGMAQQDSTAIKPFQIHAPIPFANCFGEPSTLHAPNPHKDNQFGPFMGVFGDYLSVGDPTHPSWSEQNQTGLKTEGSLYLYRLSEIVQDHE